MPLFKSRSKKSEEKAKHGDSLSIALNIARKAGRMPKKAKGGEITANSEKRASLDDSDDSREMSMLKGSRPSMERELDARDESMDGIDDASDRAEMDMLHGKRFSRGGEISALHEKMGGIDDEDMDRDMDMLPKRPGAQKELDAKAERHASADESDERSQGMLRRSKRADSYSRDGIVRYAEGGEVEEDESIADAIRRRAKAPTDDEMADVAENAVEHRNMEDDLNFDAADKEVYDESDALDDLDYPAGNLKGHEAEDDHDEDMVSAIRRRMKSRR